MLNLDVVSGFYQFNSKLIGSNFSLVLMLLSLSWSANKDVPMHRDRKNSVSN